MILFIYREIKHCKINFWSYTVKNIKYEINNYDIFFLRIIMMLSNRYL